jgi:predicted dehydrogenase
MNAIVIGFGNIGKLHYSKLISKGINVPIIVDSNPWIVDVGSEVYSDLNEVPDFDNIDFIFICTPTHTHFDILNKALKKNLPIFLEKPAVRNLEEIEVLKKVKNGFIFVGEVELFNPDLQQFLKYKPTPSGIMIKRKVNLNYFLKGNKPWFLDEKLSGGIVLDLMIHDITLLIYKFGIPKIKSVNFLKKIFKINDLVKVILSFDGFEAEIVSSWIENDEKTPIKVSIDIFDNKGSAVTITSNNYISKKGQTAFDNQFEYFLRSVKENKLPYSLSLFLDATKLCLDINNVILTNKI